MNFINRNKTSKKLPTEFNGNRPGEKNTDQKTIPNALNDYFKTIIPGQAIKLPKQQNIL